MDRGCLSILKSKLKVCWEGYFKKNLPENFFLEGFFFRPFSKGLLHKLIVRDERKEEENCTGSDACKRRFQIRGGVGFLIIVSVLKVLFT